MTSSKPKTESLSALIGKLDRLTSEVVRRSAADSSGMVKCISCEIRIHWKNAQCAHFVNRSNSATRFDLRNLAPSCSQCNCFDEDTHLQKWEQKLGPELAEELRSNGRSLRKFMRYELETGIDLMKQKLNQLK